MLVEACGLAVSAAPTFTSTSWPVKCLVTKLVSNAGREPTPRSGQHLLYLHPEGQAVLHLQAADGPVTHRIEVSEQIADGNFE